MSKKSIWNIPETKGKTLNYKLIGMIVASVIAVFAFSFMTFNSGEKKKEEKEIKTTKDTASKIDESETLSTQKNIDEALSSNPILEESYEDDNAESEELEKLRMQREMELERMRFELEQQRLELERQRRAAGLTLISNSKEVPREEKNNNPYAGLEIPPIPPLPEEDPNLQKKKEEFSEKAKSDTFVLKNRLESAVGRYEVKAGTVIPLTLETAINSDLPGVITAVVKSDVYDSKNGNTLLIPAGSRVIGKYSSNVSFGQERVQAVFNRITLPNQESINIDAMYLTDLMGATGVKDKVDTKIGRVFSSVIMSAILGVGAGAVKEDTGSEWKNNAIDGGGTQAINVGNQYAQKLLNVQPTLTIRNGYTVGLFIDKDLVLKPYKY